MSLFTRFKVPTIILLILCIITGSFLASAHEAKASFYFLKEFVIKPLVKKIANSLANKLANRVLGQVGNNKRPNFVLNWRNLILESQGRGNDTFRSIIKGTDYCSWMKDSIIKSFGADFSSPISGSSIADTADGGFRTYINPPGTTPFDFINKCTFTYNIDDFKGDFTKGGWDAWLQLIQPQNNVYGALSNASIEQERQKELDQQAEIAQSIAGQGFTANRKDTSNNDGPGGCSIGGNNRCTVLGRVLTPEKIIGDAGAKALDAKIGSYYNATELTDVINLLFQSILGGVLSKIKNFSGVDLAPFIEDALDASPGTLSGGGGGGGNDPVSNADAQGKAANDRYQACLNTCNSQPTPQCNNEPIENGGACRNNALLQCRGNCALQ